MTRPDGQPVGERFGRWIAARGWVHVLLLTGVAICIYPIVWMFMTSIKTDDELGQSRLIPSIPLFRERSPYVRDPADTVRPVDVPPSRFSAALPTLREVTRARVSAGAPSETPPGVDRNLWAASASSVLINR